MAVKKKSAGRKPARRAVKSKPAGSARKKSGLKTRVTGASVEKFLDAIDDPVRRADCHAVVGIMRRVTGAEPRMWGSSIVGFDTYHYKYASGQEADWPIACFSPRKQNLVVYLALWHPPVRQLLQSLGPHSNGKSCLYLRQLADVDRDVLEKMIRESVHWAREKYPKTEG